MLVDRYDVSMGGVVPSKPAQKRFLLVALDDYRMGIRMRLDLEAFLELRVQECVESVLPAPCRIDRCSHHVFPNRSATAIGAHVLRRTLRDGVAHCKAA